MIGGTSTAAANNRANAMNIKILIQSGNSNSGRGGETLDTMGSQSESFNILQCLLRLRRSRDRFEIDSNVLSFVPVHSSGIRKLLSRCTPNQISIGANG